MSCGIGAGVAFSMFRGSAHDEFGVTHFSGYSHMSNTGNSGILGCDMSVGIDVSYDFHFDSFYHYLDNSFSLDCPFEIHADYGGGIGYSAHSEDKIDGIIANIGIGIGMSLNFGSDNVTLHEAISVSYEEANLINSNPVFGKIWHVKNVKYDYFSNIYSGYVNGKIRVFSKAIVVNGSVQPDNIWKSQEYSNNETTDGN